MNKKKDFFETVLSDVSPIRKKLKDKKALPKKIITKTKLSAPPPTLQPKDFSKNNPDSDEKKQKKHESKNIINDKSSFYRKLKRGKVRIDKKIDLHGLSLLEAEDVFKNRLEESFNSGLRCLLFITGKKLYNKNKNTNDDRLYFGKIRSNIYSWALKTYNQEKILYFSEAHQAHGGAGSFYVYLRKK